MSLINREALYEKACDLEAQALSYVGKISNDETKIEEWRIWSAILAERTAFKHDIFDASEVKFEQKWIPCSERLPEKCGNYLVTTHDGNVDVGIKDLINENMWIACDSDGFYWLGNVVAWMPMPEPYREEGADMREGEQDE